MTTTKRLRRSMLIHKNNFATSTSAFIETKLTPTTSLSQTTDNQPVDLQEQTDECHGSSTLVQDHFEILSKTATKNKHTNGNITKTIVHNTQNNCEDDWVCPVAVALRRAGYNVPLRPSKSWLERDRKKQALLRKQQTSSKEL